MFDRVLNTPLDSEPDKFKFPKIVCPLSQVRKTYRESVKYFPNFQNKEFFLKS